jgi:dihydrofolate reductase
MSKIIASVWQTVDGVIDASSMDKWFMPFDSESRGKYINDTIHDCEAMLYGRITYEMLSGYWSQQRSNEFGVADKLNTNQGKHSCPG